MTEHDLATMIADLHHAVIGQRLNRAELAARLRIDPATVSRRVKCGTLPAPKGGYWMLADIVSWEREQPRRPAHQRRRAMSEAVGLK